MEGFVAPTSSPHVVDLHEIVFDFSCYLDDTEKVVNTILSMTPLSQLNTAFKSVKSHLKAARDFGTGANLTTGAALVTIPDVVPPIPHAPGQPKLIKRKPTSTVSKPPQTETQNDPPTMRGLLNERSSSIGSSFSTVSAKPIPLAVVSLDSRYKKNPKVTGKTSATPTANPPKEAPGKSSGPEEGEITGDTEQPIEEGSVGGPEPETGAADSTDKPGIF